MHPILLTGAALVGLPILLHLIMRQEPKRQPLPTFRFLKMKQRINERKIRLRHWLLLAMRMLLIALIALALFQPTLLSNRFNIHGSQPIAAVIVLDTSSSMGYEVANRAGLTEARQKGLRLLEETNQGPWTLLDDARFRAMELIDELPPNSKVAIIDSSERIVDWSPTAFDAKKKIQSIKRTRGNSQPVTRGIEQAINLFAKMDRETQGDTGPMPRLMVVLSDRTVPSWDSARLPDIQASREKVPKPEIYTVYIDLGIDKPVNLAIRDVLMETPVLAIGDEAIIRVTLEATGGAVENIVVCKFDAENESDKKPVKIAAGETAQLEFRKSGLKAGLHTAEITLATPDALPFDNTRYASFQIKEPRRILAIADAPDGYGYLSGGAGQMLRADTRTNPFRTALSAYRGFLADLARTDDVVNWLPQTWAKYEAVALCAIENPPAELWTALQAYLEAGGQVVVFPAGPEMNKKAYDDVAAGNVLPGKYIDFKEREKADLGWAWDSLNYQHPMLAPFAEWRKDPNIDFVKLPPMVRKYWQMEAFNKQSVRVPFVDDPVPDLRSPALLERRIGERGRVLMYAMTFDERRDVKTDAPWHNYNEGSSFQLVLSILTLRYLVGETQAVRMNYETGQMVLVKWPTDPKKNEKPFFLAGPDVLNSESQVKRDPKEAYFRWPPEKTGTAGLFTLANEDKSWAEGFSLNIPGTESDLARVPIEQVETFFGKEGVAAADKDLKLREVLKGHLSQPVELFPFLMVLLLLFLAFENLLANKFYSK